MEHIGNYVINKKALDFRFFKVATGYLDDTTGIILTSSMR